MRKTLSLALVLFSVRVIASDDPPRLHPGRGEAKEQHFMLTAEHTLRPAEEAELAASGLRIINALPNARYIVRAVAPDAVAADPRVASVELIAPSRKVARSAIREAARAASFARVRLVFHSDVAYDDAREAVEQLGGTIDQTLQSDFVVPQRVEARIPFGTLSALAADDRVLAIYGPPLKIASTNAVAAQLSHVTPLFSAPYDLTGNGVVLSEFELGQADATHPEFGGRLTNHLSGGLSSDQMHATHTAGTVIAAGINPAAKGMAPSATLHMFDVRLSYGTVMNTKQSQLPALGIVADNNSWGFTLGWQGSTWWGGDEVLGGYDGTYAASYDDVARASSILFVQSSGNDGEEGRPVLDPPYYQHTHYASDPDDTTGDKNLCQGKTFCYSADGSGNDCPAPCSTGTNTCDPYYGDKYCEILRHPLYGPFTTIGPTASLKNVIAVGAVGPEKSVAGFSSRGPTQDGRVKPDLVAKGVGQISTVPGGGYRSNQGTSMSAPVVTGITGLLVEQWRRTFAGANPLPVTLRALLIAGADDLGNAGPDYSYGFGLVDAQASVDLIRGDGNTGSHIRLGNISQGQQIETPLAVASSQNVRVVVTWTDPAVLLLPDELAEKTLVNDLDVKIVDAAGNATLAYVLDKDHPNAVATRGNNSVDNVEEVEIPNAAPGAYRVILTGTNVANGPQQYALVANAQLGSTAVACNDAFEPNDSEATAFGFLVNRATVAASTCSATDIDYYKVRTLVAGPLSLTVTGTGTPIRVTLSGSGITPIVQDVAAGATRVLSTSVASGTYFVRIEPNGPLGVSASYALVPSFTAAPSTRRRSTQH